VQTFYTATGLTPNVYYTFQIQARNAVGVSTFTPYITILAAAIPAVPAAPVTSVISNTGVTITWNSPYDGGSPITVYTI